MTQLVDVVVHAGLDAQAALITHVSIHSADPGITGANEVSGGSYARQPVTWAASASRQKANSGALSTPMPAGSTGAFYGYWSALTGGLFRGSAPVRGAGAVQGIGTADATTDTITSNAHGLVVGNTVMFEKVFGETLPTGLTVNVIYWVKTVTTNTFTLSATNGGATLDITGNGDCMWMQSGAETFTNAGTLNTAPGALILDGTALATT